MIMIPGRKFVYHVNKIFNEKHQKLPDRSWNLSNWVKKLPSANARCLSYYLVVTTLTQLEGILLSNQATRDNVLLRTNTQKTHMNYSGHRRKMGSDA